MIAYHNLTIQERATAAWVLSLLVVVFCLLSGCTRNVSVAEDESRMREEFSIPTEVKLVSLWRSSDQPGVKGTLVQTQLKEKGFYFFDVGDGDSGN